MPERCVCVLGGGAVVTPVSLINLMYDIKCFIIIFTRGIIVQELCESRGGRPELSVLTSLLVSVDVKNY